MKSVIITPRNNDEFEMAFDWMTEFGNGRKPLTWEGKGDIGFAFLMKEANDTKADSGKVVDKKNTR